MSSVRFLIKRFASTVSNAVSKTTTINNTPVVKNSFSKIDGLDKYQLEDLLKNTLLSTTERPDPRTVKKTLIEGLSPADEMNHQYNNMRNRK